MRDRNRIHKFCNELANLWLEKAPDWRFGQLVCNAFGYLQSNGTDPFFPEEDSMLEEFKEFFDKMGM